MKEAQQYEFDKLVEHVGHKVVVVTYGGNQNVSIECETCNEVLYDVDNQKV